MQKKYLILFLTLKHSNDSSNDNMQFVRAQFNSIDMKCDTNKINIGLCLSTNQGKKLTLMPKTQILQVYPSNKLNKIYISTPITSIQVNRQVSYMNFKECGQQNFKDPLRIPLLSIRSIGDCDDIRIYNNEPFLSGDVSAERRGL